MLKTKDFIILTIYILKRIKGLLLLLLLLFIPGKNSMGLCGKLLYYVCLGEPFRKKIYAFFAF